MAGELVRFWQEININELTRSLLVVGELTAECANCKELGIDYKAAKNCPRCGAAFKHIASRLAHGGGRFGVVNRIKQNRPDLSFVDFEDFKDTLSKVKAREFFK